ncbi:hypothetical protein BH24PSE1_BH24PSE1_10900 [soil metagenome]
MTKLEWRRANQHEPDPGAMIDAPEETQPSKWTPPAERIERQRQAVEVEKARVSTIKRQREDEDRRKAIQKIRRKERSGIPLEPLERLQLTQWEMTQRGL